MLTTTTEPHAATDDEAVAHPWIIRAVAWVITLLLHPLFIPVLVVAYLAFMQPGYFTGVATKDKTMMLLRVGLNTVFFPLVTVLLLKGLGFIQSIQLKTRRERIIPIVATNIFYFWVFLVFKNDPAAPVVVTIFLLGIFIASSLALVLNSFLKVSMHALGMGAFCGILLVTIFDGAAYGTFLPLMIVVLLTGVVGTARLVLGSHRPADITAGIIIAILSQLIAFAILS